MKQCFIPSLTGMDPLSPLDRDWISLPCRLGSLSLPDPRKSSFFLYTSSLHLCTPLIKNLHQQSDTFSYEDQLQQIDLRKQNSIEQEKLWQDWANIVFERLSLDRQRLMELTCEKGASSWLTAIPLEDHGFALNGSTFRDVLCLRFGWPLPQSPSTCMCGKSFIVEHALNRPMGDLQTHHHNEIRDLTFGMLKELCHNVSVEPSLQPLRGEHFENRSTRTDEGDKLDIAADSFWESGRRTFFDIRVFNPIAATKGKLSLLSCYSRSSVKNLANSMREFVRWSLVHSPFWCSLHWGIWVNI